MLTNCQAVSVRHLQVLLTLRFVFSFFFWSHVVAVHQVAKVLRRADLQFERDQELLVDWVDDVQDAVLLVAVGFRPRVAPVKEVEVVPVHLFVERDVVELLEAVDVDAQVVAVVFPLVVPLSFLLFEYDGLQWTTVHVRREQLGGRLLGDHRLGTEVVFEETSDTVGNTWTHRVEDVGHPLRNTIMLAVTRQESAKRLVDRPVVTRRHEQAEFVSVRVVGLDVVVLVRVEHGLPLFTREVDRGLATAVDALKRKAGVLELVLDAFQALLNVVQVGHVQKDAANDALVVVLASKQVELVAAKVRPEMVRKARIARALKSLHVERVHWRLLGALVHVGQVDVLQNLDVAAFLHELEDLLLRERDLLLRRHGAYACCALAGFRCAACCKLANDAERSWRDRPTFLAC